MWWINSEAHLKHLSWINSEALATNIQIIHRELKISHRMEKKLMLSRFIKKKDKRLKENYRPISLLPICGKILERLLMTRCFNFSQIMNQFLPIDQASNQKTSASINCYVFLTTFINLSMTALRQELYFLTYQKHMIKFGMRVYFINWSKIVYQASFSKLSNIF